MVQVGSRSAGDLEGAALAVEMPDCHRGGVAVVAGRTGCLLCLILAIIIIVCGAIAIIIAIIHGARTDPISRENGQKSTLDLGSAVVE